MNIFEKTIQICKENNINPARSKGQNFLINENVYDEIIEAAELTKDDVVLEVGPGLGFLTRKLAQKVHPIKSGEAGVKQFNRVKKVIAVELDDKLASLLSVRLKKEGIDNVEVVNEDILNLNYKLQFPNSKQIQNSNFKIDTPYKIVANLPYNITSVFLRKFLETKNKPKSMVLMLQKEVAERIVAKKGKMSLLAVSVQFYAKAEMLFKVPASDFYPAPQVDSAVVGLEVLGTRDKNISEKEFFRLVKHGFSSRRKMLKNNLSAGFQISQKEAGERIVKAGFKETARAQELSVEDWVNLLNYFS